MLQKFGHGATVSDQQLASGKRVPLSQEVGGKQGNLGRSPCHVERRCELVIGSRTVATRRGHSDLSVVLPDMRFQLAFCTNYPFVHVLEHAHNYIMITGVLFAELLHKHS